MRVSTIMLGTILCLTLCAPAFAGDLYNNGPTNGTSQAYFLDTIFAVSDSFTVSGNSTMGSFTFAEWVPAGSTPLTVDWAVGTSSFGGDVGSGTSAAISGNLLCSAGSNFNGGMCGGGVFDVYNSTVNTGALSLSAGTTYWLTLTNATDSFGGRDAWDVNSGPSLAYHSTIGAIPSESFTIGAGSSTTTTGTTPEPSSIVLLGSGLLGFAGILRRKLG